MGTSKINRENIERHLLEYQLNLIGKSIEDTKNVEEWFRKWTLTEEQFKQFKIYAIPLLKKVFKFNKSKAEQTFYWFDLNLGLRVLNKDE